MTCTLALLVFFFLQLKTEKRKEKEQKKLTISFTIMKYMIHIDSLYTLVQFVVCRYAASNILNLLVTVTQLLEGKPAK